MHDPLIRVPCRDHWRYLVRAVVWQPLLLAGAIAAALAYRGFRGPEQTMAAATVAIGCAFVLDDPAWSTLGSSPAPLWWRRALRLMLILPVAAALWVASTWVAGAALGPAAIEVALLVAVVLSASGLVIRGNDDGMGGAGATPLALAAVVCLHLLPDRWALYPVVAHEWRWAALIFCAILALLLVSRDPAHRRPHLARTSVD